MFVVLAAAVVGGAGTAFAFLPVSVLLAVVAAPIGGSVCGLLAAVALFYLRGAQWRHPDEAEEHTDSMVAALRKVAALGHRAVERDQPAKRNKRAA